jgi:hypothetical protein
VFGVAGFEIFSDYRSEHGDDLVKHLPPCDVINLHWIARYVDYEASLSAVPKRTPLVWPIAGMNPITGGCHYDEGCGKYLDGCGSYPQLGSDDANDIPGKCGNESMRSLATLNLAGCILSPSTVWAALMFQLWHVVFIEGKQVEAPTYGWRSL